MSGEYIYEVGPSPLFLFLVVFESISAGWKRPDVRRSVSQADDQPWPTYIVPDGWAKTTY